MSKPRRGFRHWLGEKELPEPLPTAILLRYYQLLRHAKNSGVRKVAAKKIVMGHVRLGMSIVARWALGYAHRTDDMVSVMLEALVDGVQLISEGALDHHIGDPEIGGYLVQTIYGRINKFLRRPLVAVSTVPIRGTHERAMGRKGEQESYDLREIIDRSIETDQERNVIDLRIQGLSDEEVGQVLQPPLTKQRVFQIRDQVRRRIQEQL